MERFWVIMFKVCDRGEVRQRLGSLEPNRLRNRNQRFHQCPQLRLGTSRRPWVRTPSAGCGKDVECPESGSFRRLQLWAGVSARLWADPVLLGLPAGRECAYLHFPWSASCSLPAFPNVGRPLPRGGVQCHSPLCSLSTHQNRDPNTPQQAYCQGISSHAGTVRQIQIRIA